MANQIVERTRAAWSALFQRSEPQADTPQGVVTTDPNDLVQLTALNDWQSLFHVDQYRTRRLRELAEMDTGDVAVQIDATVDAALMFEEEESSDDPLMHPESFKIVFPSKSAKGRAADGSAQARAIIEELLERTRLRQELDVWARDMLAFGDGYMEIVPDANDETVVAKLMHKRVDEIVVHRDLKGRLMTEVDRDGNPLAYQQVDAAGKVYCGWYPHEIIHFKLFPDNALTYSKKGMNDDIRQEWRKMNWIEQGMVIARVVRAYPRFLHVLDMTGKGEAKAREIMRNYIQSLTYRQSSDQTAKRTPMSVDEDIFVTTGFHQDNDGKFVSKNNKVELLDPSNNGLGAIEDVRYARRKLTARVPAEIIGINDNNGQDLTSQDIAYGRFVRRLQLRLEDGIRELITRTLKLRSIDPKTVNYRVIWPKVMVSSSWKLADSQFRISMAQRNDLEAGFTSPQQVLRERGKSEEEIAKIMDEWQAYMKLQNELSTQQQLDMAQGQADISVDTAKKMKKVNPPQPAQADPNATTPEQPNGTKGAKPAAGGKRRTGTQTQATSGVGQATAGHKSGG